MIDTLDDLITELTKLKETMPLGGQSPIAIDDADTGYHMRIFKLRPSNNHPERVLVVGAGYHRDDGTLPQ